MVRLREEYDSKRAERASEYSSFPTEKNICEVFCDMCGEFFFVDADTSEKVSRALRAGFGNPFVCDDCRGKWDEAAYPER